LTGGKGTDIIEDSNHNGSFSDPEDEIKKVGGGMILHKAGLTSRRNKIMNNGDSSTKEGGAVYAAGTGADIPDDQPADPPDDHFPNERLLIEFEETIFSGNYAQIGHTVMVNGWDMENQFIDMDLGNFVFDCAFDKWKSLMPKTTVMNYSKRSGNLQGKGANYGKQQRTNMVFLKQPQQM
jgi:hypothetical protein